VLRRVNVPKTDGASAPLRFGDLQIDFERHEVRVKGKLTRLAPRSSPSPTPARGQRQSALGAITA